MNVAIGIGLTVLVLSGVGVAGYFIYKHVKENGAGQTQGTGNIQTAGYAAGQSTPDRGSGDAWGNFLTGLGTGLLGNVTDNFFGSGYNSDSGQFGKETSWFGSSGWGEEW